MIVEYNNKAHSDQVFDHSKVSIEFVISKGRLCEIMAELVSNEVAYGRPKHSDFTVHYSDGNELISFHVNAAKLAEASGYFDGVVDALSYGSDRSDDCNLSSRCSEKSRRCITLPSHKLGVDIVSCDELRKFFDILYKPSVILKDQLNARSRLGEWRKYLKAGDVVQFALYSPHYNPRSSIDMDWVIGTITSIKNGLIAEISYKPADEDDDADNELESDVVVDRLQPFGKDSRIEYSAELSQFLLAHRTTISIASYFQCEDLLDIYQSHCTTLHCTALDRLQSEPLWSC